jgi:hypothetical protein
MGETKDTLDSRGTEQSPLADGYDAAWPTPVAEYPRITQSSQIKGRAVPEPGRGPLSGVP